MCFHIDKENPVPRIANMAIPCYKLMKGGSYSRYASLVQNFLYDNGRYDLGKPLKIENNEINEGFHSFSTISQAKVLYNINHDFFADSILFFIIDCVIPPKTTYYYDRKNNEYISESIIIGRPHNGS